MGGRGRSYYFLCRGLGCRLRFLFIYGVREYGKRRGWGIFMFVIYLVGVFLRRVKGVRLRVSFRVWLGRVGLLVILRFLF